MSESINDLFNMELFDAGYISSELYDFSKAGTLSIKGFLKEPFRQALLSEMKQQSYVKAPREYLNAIQELEYVDIKSAEQIEAMSNVINLLHAYSHMHDAVAKIANFSKARLAITLQRYWEGSIGLTPHMNPAAKYKNIVSIYVVDGEALFYTCKDKSGNGRRVIESSPGSMILMRAPRNDDEKELRPLHGVGTVTKERYVIGIRDIPIA